MAPSEDVVVAAFVAIVGVIIGVLAGLAIWSGDMTVMLIGFVAIAFSAVMLAGRRGTRLIATVYFVGCLSGILLLSIPRL